MKALVFNNFYQNCHYFMSRTNIGLIVYNNHSQVKDSTSYCTRIRSKFYCKHFIYCVQKKRFKSINLKSAICFLRTYIQEERGEYRRHGYLDSLPWKQSLTYKQVGMSIHPIVPYTLCINTLHNIYHVVDDASSNLCTWPRDK